MKRKSHLIFQADFPVQSKALVEGLGDDGPEGIPGTVILNADFACKLIGTLLSSVKLCRVKLFCEFPFYDEVGHLFAFLQI